MHSHAPTPHRQTDDAAGQGPTGTGASPQDATPAGLAPEADTELARLRERDACFGQIAQACRHGFWVVDLWPQRQTVYVSPGFERLWGLPAQAFYADSERWSASIVAEDRPEVVARFERWAQDPQQHAFAVEYRLLQADGGVRWISDQGTPVFDNRGRAIRLTGVAEDITERKALEAAWRREAAAAAAERDRLCRLAEAVPGVLHELRRTADGRLNFPFGGERAAALYGLPADALLEDASAMAARVHPDDLQAVNQAVRRSLSSLSPWSAQYRVRNAQDVYRWIEGHANPSREADGGVVWHGELTDITDRKVAEQALLASRLQLGTVFNTLIDGLMIWDVHEKRHDWNPAALRMYGLDKLVTVPQRREDFSRMFELLDDDGRALRVDEWPISRTLRGEAVQALELTLRQREQGWEKRIRFSAALVRDEAQQPIVAFVHMSDVTEPHRQQAEIRRLNAELEQRVQERTAQLQSAVKELEAFSYSVSHDLRAPLRAIDGFSQAVQQDFSALLPADGQRYLGIIRESALKMGQLIDDLLAFSRVGRAPMKRHPIDTTMLVNDALAQVAPLTEGRSIEWRIAELPDCQGDLALLRQVWINLLSNAVKYSRGRTPAVIEVGCLHHHGQPPAYFVRDNGAGFDMRYAHKLFGVFERLHRADQFEGTGVGLAIVQRIVQRHGGQIQADAAPDRGATFTFTLEAKA